MGDLSTLRYIDYESMITCISEHTGVDYLETQTFMNGQSPTVVATTGTGTAKSATDYVTVETDDPTTATQSIISGYNAIPIALEGRTNDTATVASVITSLHKD